MFLLDTNAVSESRKLATSNVDPVFKNWIDEIDPNLLYVSVIRISRRDTRQGIVLREWFDMEIKPNYEGRVLDITPDIAYTCARLNVPDPRPYQDAWIAATALVHGMTVVTRNVRDFVPMNVSLLCPFTQPH